MCISKVYSVFFDHWDKTQMWKTFSSDKINGTKNALFFLSGVPAHDSFYL